MNDMATDQADTVRRHGQHKQHLCSKCDRPGHNAATCGRPPPAPKVKPPKRVSRHRVDGHYHCSVCGELGHTSKRHDDTGTKSARAAALVRDEGLTFQAAGDREGISRAAVGSAYRSRNPDGLTPGEIAGKSLYRRVVTLAVAGKTQAEIATETGAHPVTVSHYLRCRGIKAELDRFYISDEQVARAADVVRAGGSYQDAAVAVGCSYPRLADRLRSIGVLSVATGRDRMDGRTQRAIDRVLSGESVPDACRSERCATPTVYIKTKEARAARAVTK